MHKFLVSASLIIFLFLSSLNSAFSQNIDKNIVIEESYYVVNAENKDKFVETYKTKLFPFWQEMKKMGIIVDDYRMYSQRVHTLKPLWSYKTVVKFKNYAAIDKWLEIRDDVYKKLFPNEAGYKEPRKIIDSITEDHWDEFIRELNLSE